MSKKTIRLLAVSAIALSAVSLGYHRASAFSFGSSFILSQAGGSSGGSGPAGGGAGSTGAAPGGDSNAPGGALGAPGSSPADTPGAGSESRSQGVPAQCASIVSATERASCIEQLSREGKAPATKN